VFLTHAQSRSQFSLWSILNAPLLLSNDIRVIDKPQYKWVKDIIANEEVITVNQDVGYSQGQLTDEQKVGTITVNGTCETAKCTRTEIWTKRITEKLNTFATVLFNRAGLTESDTKFSSEKITLTWKNLGIPAGQKMLVRDLWNRKDVGIYSGSFTSLDIPQNDVMMVTLHPLK
jgi:alpha-galactosidase